MQEEEPWFTNLSDGKEPCNKLVNNGQFGYRKLVRKLPNLLALCLQQEDVHPVATYLHCWQK